MASVMGIGGGLVGPGNVEKVFVFKSIFEEVKGATAILEKASKSLSLLRAVLALHEGGSADDTAWLTLDKWGGLLGAARRNSICVELSHPLTEFVPALEEWIEKGNDEDEDDEGATAKHRRAASELLEESLPRPLPETLFTALYSKVSWINHSCKPCAEVHFFHESHEATVLATRKINAGEEIFISYIDGNERWDVTQRRASLFDYGFECDCVKCTAEAAWKRRLRPRHQ